MTLPATTARAPAAIDRCLLPAPRLRQAADVDRRDRQKDGRTPDRYINPERHHIDENVSISCVIVCAIHGYISAENLRGSGSCYIHCSAMK